MIMRCKITKDYKFLVEFFLIPLNPLKNFSSMKLSKLRVGRKLETDKFFLGLNGKNDYVTISCTQIHVWTKFV